jgi:hypothetical protein
VDLDCDDDSCLTADLLEDGPAHRQKKNAHRSSNWWNNPDQATIRRLMGINSDLPKQDQAKQSRLMRQKVKDICGSIGITLRETWTDYKNDRLVDTMISGQYSSPYAASFYLYQ